MAGWGSSGMTGRSVSSSNSWIKSRRLLAQGMTLWVWSGEGKGRPNSSTITPLGGSELLLYLREGGEEGDKRELGEGASLPRFCRWSCCKTIVSCSSSSSHTNNPVLLLSVRATCSTSFNSNITSSKLISSSSRLPSSWSSSPCSSSASSSTVASAGPWQ